jgi:aldose sugar dehydrogenase
MLTTSIFIPTKSPINDKANNRFFVTSYSQLNLDKEQKKPQQLIDNTCLLVLMNQTYFDWGGSLGKPSSNISKTTDGLGYYQNFTKGAVYWKSGSGIHEVHGAIYDKWKASGLEKGFLGYPISDQKPTPHKDATFNMFEGGAIYWTPYTGAHEIHGGIYQKWKDLGLEESFLGYPVTDEQYMQGGNGPGSISYFQGGSVQWTQNGGAYAVHGKDYLQYFQSKGIAVPLKVNAAETTRINKDITIEPVFNGVKFPTSMAFLGPNDFLVLEKNKGMVQRIINGNMLKEPLLDVNVASRGERGMLGVAVTSANIVNNSDTNLTKPNDTMITSKKTYVYLYFTQSRTKDTGDLCDEILQKEVMGNYLYRYELSSNGTRLINPKLLLSLPATLSALHNGGKILIGPDNNVYLIVGDLRFQQTKAQNKINGTDPNGSGVIYRITQVGKPASGNPFGDSVESMVDKFFAYGIRNSFGMDFDPVTGKLWDTENGEDNYDEINLVEPGFNSGWTKIQGLAKYAPAGFNINGSLVKYLSDQNIREGKYRDPEFVWNITVGVTAIKFLNSDTLGEQYKNDMLVGDIDNENLYRFKLNQNRTGLVLNGSLADKLAGNSEETEEFLIAKGFGSITDIKLSPDDYVYLASIEEYYPTVDGDGTIYKIIPSKLQE